MKTSYNKIVEHYEECLKKYGDTFRGVDWPNERDAIKRYQVMLDVVNVDKVVSLLDFGCGASHMYQYIKEHELSTINYSGLDVSSAFVELSLSKYPQNKYYHVDILKDSTNVPNFDFIICNGVFTEKRELTFDDMWDYFQSMLKAIFDKANIGLAFNVMSTAVDWERWDLFHLPTDQLIAFMTKELSRNFIIRNDYGLYEYTVYIYK